MLFVVKLLHVYLLLLGLRIEKVVYHRDDNGHALHQRNVCCVGQYGQSRCRARPHVAMNIAALQAKHFRNVIEPYAIGIAMDKKNIGALVALSLSAPKSYGLKANALM